MQISNEQFEAINADVMGMSADAVFEALHNFREQMVGNVKIDFTPDNIDSLDLGKARHCLFAIKKHEIESADLSQASF